MSSDALFGVKYNLQYWKMTTSTQKVLSASWILQAAEYSSLNLLGKCFDSEPQDEYLLPQLSTLIEDEQSKGNLSKR
jgi:hypothetical protein